MEPGHRSARKNPKTRRFGQKGPPSPDTRPISRAGADGQSRRGISVPPPSPKLKNMKPWGAETAHVTGRVGAGDLLFRYVLRRIPRPGRLLVRWGYSDRNRISEMLRR